MIRQLKVNNFKAFSQFKVDFAGRDTYLIGPNNAGKSTLIAALRASAEMLRLASRRKAMETRRVEVSYPRGHVFSAEQVNLVTENLRHEFSQSLTSLAVVFGDGCDVQARWDIDDDPMGFFWLRQNDVNLITPKEATPVFPNICVVPVLSPLEHTEEVLSEKHVRENYSTRLASRHFRNQVALLPRGRAEDHGTYEGFVSFVSEWAPEIELKAFKAQKRVDLYFREPGARVEREIFWAGDGLQIWLQILLHMYRAKESDIVVLDEPDVFLHADLQRRLVGLLDATPAQTITATHSSELIAEADPKSVVWVTKSRKRGVRAPKDSLLDGMTRSLGTSFNLGLARALRSRCVVFVEGQDMKLLRTLAATLGAHRFARENGVSVIPLAGFDRWGQTEAFAWIAKDLLQGSIKSHVLLDRDLRSQSEVDDIVGRLATADIAGHVWKRHELENYLLSPAALARLCGLDPDEAKSFLFDAADSLEDEVHSLLSAHCAQLGRRSKMDDKAVARLFKGRWEECWGSADRLSVCPGKEVLSAVNSLMQEAGRGSFSTRSLAGAMRASDIPDELRAVVLDIEVDASK